MGSASRFRIASLCLAALVSAPAGALVVGLAPAQAGEIPLEAPAAPPMGSLASGCLGALFEAGIIATDAPCYGGDRAEWARPSFGLAEAAAGLVDYVVAVYADWRPSSFKRGAWIAARVDYRLVRVSDGTAITSGLLEGPVDSYEAALAADSLAGRIGSAIGSACAAALRSRSPGGKQ